MTKVTVTIPTGDWYVIDPVYVRSARGFNNVPDFRGDPSTQIIKLDRTGIMLDGYGGEYVIDSGELGVVPSPLRAMKLINGLPPGRAVRARKPTPLTLTFK